MYSSIWYDKYICLWPLLLTFYRVAQREVSHGWQHMDHVRRNSLQIWDLEKHLYEDQAEYDVEYMTRLIIAVSQLHDVADHKVMWNTEDCWTDSFIISSEDGIALLEPPYFFSFFFLFDCCIVCWTVWKDCGTARECAKWAKQTLLRGRCQSYSSHYWQRVILKRGQAAKERRDPVMAWARPRYTHTSAVHHNIIYHQVS